MHSLHGDEPRLANTPMRTPKQILATASLVSVTVFTQAAPDDNAYLLKTHWYQDGPFAAFTPNHERVGCWSTAYAQILYSHGAQTGLLPLRQLQGIRALDRDRWDPK